MEEGLAAEPDRLLTERIRLCNEGCVDVLVVDIGGTRVKMRATGTDETRRCRSGTAFTPAALVEQVKVLTADWHYDVIALGYLLERQGREPCSRIPRVKEWSHFRVRHAE